MMYSHITPIHNNKILGYCATKKPAFSLALTEVIQTFNH
jgi:hypothetical protein